MFRPYLAYTICSLRSMVEYLNVLSGGASNSITDFSMLSNPTGIQNVSCLELCGRNICPKSCKKGYITPKYITDS